VESRNDDCVSELDVSKYARIRLFVTFKRTPPLLQVDVIYVLYRITVGKTCPVSHVSNNYALSRDRLGRAGGIFGWHKKVGALFSLAQIGNVNRSLL
jgi:hypothetical protein